MGRYDFDKSVDRSGIDSLKWDVKKGELPMWVADMDIEVCPDIIDAMKQRLEKPTLGYNVIPNAWYEAYIGWWKNRHGLEIDREWMMFSTGVVPSISSIVRRLTLPAEKVLLQTPVYNIFFNCVVNNGRYVEECPLTYDGGEYGIDFAELEKKLSDPQVTLMILCNPHNPVGKNWDRATLEKIGELCYDNNVKIISDEIHCDLQRPGACYTPTLCASDKLKSITAMLVAPSKAFNIAGLHTSAIVVPDPALRRRICRGINNDEIAEPNTFACLAAIAAFNKGGDWLDEFNAYVAENMRFAAEYIKKNAPLLSPVKGEATYLMWIDCKKVCADSVELCGFLRKETGLFVCDGAEYGESGRSFLRVNVACGKSLVMDGVKRLCDGVKKFAAERARAPKTIDKKAHTVV